MPIENAMCMRRCMQLRVFGAAGYGIVEVF